MIDVNINKQSVLEAMKNKNIATQTELAERLRMSKSQLSQILSKDFHPLKTNVVKLMDELDLSYDEIISVKDTAILSDHHVSESTVGYSTRFDQIELFDDKPFNRFDYKLDEYLSVNNVTPAKDYTLVETFAGAGGLGLGLEQAGLYSKAAIEVDSKACDTLRYNREHWNVIEGDIEEIAEQGLYNHPSFNFEGDIDVLSGGYPCQSFSYAGLGKGLKDTRGTLFYPFSQLLNELRPKIFIAENVKGLVNHDNGNTLDTMLKVFEESGYYVSWNVLNAWDYDVAQKRERIFIIGIREDLYLKQEIPFYFPKKQEYQPVLSDVIKNVPDSAGVSYSEKKRKVLEMVPPGGCWVDLPDDTAKDYMGASYNSGGGRRGMARRLSWDEPSLTLTTSPSQKQTERCHPSETRPFTVREYARIQSFPDDWKFQGGIGNQYKQIGNAVPVNLAKYVGLAVVNYLNQFK